MLRLKFSANGAIVRVVCRNPEFGSSRRVAYVLWVLNSKKRIRNFELGICWELSWLARLLEFLISSELCDRSRCLPKS